jgi:hypothetical protein
MASSCAAVVLLGAIPSRAEAGIAIESTDTIAAAVINRIRLIILVPPGREAAACYHNFPTSFSFQTIPVFVDPNMRGHRFADFRLCCLFFPFFAGAGERSGTFVTGKCSVTDHNPRRIIQ